MNGKIINKNSARKILLSSLIVILLVSVMSLAQVVQAAYPTIQVGSYPSGIAFASSNDNVYVTNSNDDSVSVISTSTNTVVATIKVGSFPGGVAFAPSNGDMYVANAFSNTVSVINTLTNTVVGSPIPVGSQPTGVAFAPSNDDIYVANVNSGTVSVISTSTNTVVATIKVGSFPSAVAFAPSNGDIYVTNAGSNSVSAISTSTNTVVATIPVGHGPLGVAFAPSNGNIYVANENNANTVSVINTSTNTVDATITVEVNPSWIAYASSNGDIYVTHVNSNSVSAISTSTNTVVATIPVGLWPSGVAFASSDNDIYVVNGGDETVSVIPALLFEDGFENNFGGWTATYGSPTIVSSPVYSGSKAMLCSNPYSSQAYKSGFDQSSLFAEAKFMLNKNMVGQETLIAFFDSSDTPAATLMINVNGGGGVYLAVMTLLPSYSYAQYDVTDSLHANTWFSAALESSSSGCTIYFNGVAVQSVSKQDFPSIGAVSVGMFWGTGDYGDIQGTLVVDDVGIG